jgi:hypothetical protein
MYRCWFCKDRLSNIDVLTSKAIRTASYRIINQYAAVLMYFRDQGGVQRVGSSQSQIVGKANQLVDVARTTMGSVHAFQKTATELRKQLKSCCKK